MLLLLPTIAIMNYPIEAKDNQPYRRPVLVFSIDARPEHENFTEELFVDHRCPDNSPYNLDCEDEFHPDAQYGHLSYCLGEELLDGGKESPQKRLELFRGPCSAPPVLPSQPSMDLFMTDIVSDSDFLILEEITPLPVMLDNTMDGVPLLSSSELMMLLEVGSFDDSSFPFFSMTDFYKNLSRLAQELLMGSGLDMPFEELLAEAAANQARALAEASEGSSKLRRAKWKKATKRKRRRRVRIRRTMSAPPEQPLPRKEETQAIPQVVQQTEKDSSQDNGAALQQKVGHEKMVSSAFHIQPTQDHPEHTQATLHGSVPKEETKVSCQNEPVHVQTSRVRGAHFEKVQLRDSQQISQFPFQESQFEDVSSGQVQTQAQEPSFQGYQSVASRTQPVRIQEPQIEASSRPHLKPPPVTRKLEPVRPKTAPQHSHLGRSNVTPQLQASETAPRVEVKSLFESPDWLNKKAPRPQTVTHEMRPDSSVTAANSLKRSNARETTRARDMDYDIMESSELEYSRATQVSRKRKVAPGISDPAPRMEGPRKGFNSDSGNFSCYPQPTSRNHPPRQEYLGSEYGNSSSKQGNSRPSKNHLPELEPPMPKAKRRKAEHSVASLHNSVAHQRSVPRESGPLAIPRTVPQLAHLAPQSAPRIGNYTRIPVDSYYQSRDPYAEQAYYHNRNGFHAPQRFEGTQGFQSPQRSQSCRETYNLEDSEWGKVISQSFQEASLLQPPLEVYPESPSDYTAAPATNYTYQAAQPTNSYAPDEYDFAIQELVASFGEPDFNMDTFDEQMENDLYTLPGQNYHYQASQYIDQGGLRRRSYEGSGHSEYKQNYSYQVPRSFGYNYDRKYQGYGHMGDGYQSASRQRR